MDKYTIIKTIGRGHFGVVDLVRHKDDGKLYVIKQIDLHGLTDKEREEAYNEVQMLQRLRHPFIVGYKDSFLIPRLGSPGDEVLNIVMAYCDGGDMTTKIRKAKGVHFEESQVLDWFVQLALALQCCHNQGVIHRDIKSQNVFLTKTQMVRLGDFGIARVLTGTNEMAMSVVGTPFSMSPEVCENKPYGKSSDIWALGCVLYEMCMLKHAFDANNLLGLVWKIVQESYPPVPDIYSDDLRNLVREMLSKDPAVRPSIDQILAKDFIRKRLLAQIANATDRVI